MRKVAALIAAAGLLLLMGCGNENGQKESEGGASVGKIEGVWEGTIQVPAQPISIVLEFKEESGTLSIPAQGLKDYPLTNVEFADPALSFDVNLQGQRLTFEGEAEAEQIGGTFTQQGRSYPFELARGVKEEPADPEKVAEIEVEGGTMKGLEEMPEGDGPHPVAILIAGSGPTDKDGNTLALPGKNNSLKLLAEELAAAGIAVIRYDKRGIGDNASLGKSEAEMRFEDYVGDAAAWIRHAKEDGRFSEVSVIGHSEGALIGAVAASQEEADAYISVAGPGRPADEVLEEQLSAQLPPQLLHEAEAILAELRQGRTVETVQPELQSIFRPSVQPYLQSWMAFDPREELAELKAPALIIGGTRDLQVPVSDAEALHEADPAAELLIIEDMNHVLKEVEDNPESNRAAYTNPDLPLAEGLTEGILDFLKKN